MPAAVLTWLLVSVLALAANSAERGLLQPHVLLLCSGGAFKCSAERTNSLKTYQHVADNRSTWVCNLQLLLNYVTQHFHELGSLSLSYTDVRCSSNTCFSNLPHSSNDGGEVAMRPFATLFSNAETADKKRFFLSLSVM